ncbi:DUF3422 domain-containing protein [Thauera sp. CAU 1555]|uniref:DUF3422 domain-containing protein n=1 Tax=Thauera sedimentorum TaxID=2767595 RepID=A0ABR9BFM8_9RHOO|nr:DUF3422 domain-containing protein [Thauera sedimentorum]MBC9073884.1 DUF3422 domain-containing protein [Thauera sedimentorum]MBD8504803.1 DUF3422 domain-containing protein [Thauera sedimentorum]
MSLFQSHPLRQTLSDEIHARPPVAIDTPELVTYLAFLHEAGNVEREAQHLRLLAEQLGLPEPATDTGHLFLDAGRFRLKWERHNEFSSYTFFRRIQTGDSAEDNALLDVPAAWRKAIPGQLIVATHVEVRSVAEVAPDQVMAELSPHGRQTVVAKVADDAAWVFTDFQIVDGFSRFQVLDASLTRRQAGRTVQRLLEIETYRVIALLAFPVAKEVGRLLSRAEDELADLMDSIGRAESAEDERAVLARLTRLAAEVERSVAHTTFRFGAAAAYYRLVTQRIEELRETRLTGFPTIGEFMARRLTPAIDTCATMSRRQEDLSGRIARNSQLLRTRVDIELQRQNQELLAQMNRRARLQLRLQETVEGLSVVAITYYGSQLVQYLAKGGKDYIAPASPEVVTAVSIPLIAGLVALGLRRMRRALAAEEAAQH